MRRPDCFRCLPAALAMGLSLNAVTFLLGDFSTHTANSPTFLALFATGLNLAVTPVVTIGGVPVEVTFFGAASCCDGLQQINVKLPDSLAGAGRVPVIVMENTVSSNTVQVVLLPPQGQTEFPGDTENTTRNREIAGAAWIPGTSLVLVVDQNDDVLRVVDVKAKKVIQVIALSDDSHPVAVAVTSDGATAVVTESGIGKVAVVNLSTFKVTTEIETGPGPIRVAISGSLAVVVNADNDTVSIVNLANNTVLKTLEVGRGPEGIAINGNANRAYVLNEDDGSITVIDLANLSIVSTTVLDASLRLESIALTGTGFALHYRPLGRPERAGDSLQSDLRGSNRSVD
jgi:YVTN family beta-propeller protein